jgi:hypothetical protein
MGSAGADDPAAAAPFAAAGFFGSRFLLTCLSLLLFTFFSCLAFFTCLAGFFGVALPDFCPAIELFVVKSAGPSLCDWPGWFRVSGVCN